MVGFFSFKAAVLKLNKCSYLFKKKSKHMNKKLFDSQFYLSALKKTKNKIHILNHHKVQIYSTKIYIFVISSMYAITDKLLLCCSMMNHSFHTYLFLLLSLGTKPEFINRQIWMKRLSPNSAQRYFFSCPLNIAGAQYLISTRSHPCPSSPTPLRPVWRSSWITFRLEQ